MNWRVRSSTIHGTLALPGDKSIAHRSVLLAALAEGISTIDGLPDGEDVRASTSCVQALGVSVSKNGSQTTVDASGSLSPPISDLFAANSGTSMRLLAGILAGQSFDTRLTGDESLSRRPMRRVTEPLTLMGASISSRDGRAPLDIHGRALSGIQYSLPVASAQVKSCLLLAGLFANGTTEIKEGTLTRDHTERMLKALQVDVRQYNGTVAIRGGQRPQPFNMWIPGDVSSAAFFFTAALLTGGEITTRAVGVNPTRRAFVDLLERMGASVSLQEEDTVLGEPVATLTVRGEVKSSVTINADQVPPLIDELPLVALLGTQIRGETCVLGAGELRVKETDRIAAVVSVLRAMGADIGELRDGFIVRGPTPLHGAQVESFGDHRVAMMAAVAGSVASGETIVRGAEATAVSLPAFATMYREVGARIDVA